MFTKVLVANRGEIACRIIRTLRQLGIQSLSVFSDADAHSSHVALADESFRIGPGSAKQSYLDIHEILAVAGNCGCQAIHPGYGFLSENAEFAAECENAGFRFIGPTSEQIKLFGLKHVARELAARAGLPLLPGSPLLADPE